VIPANWKLHIPTIAGSPGQPPSSLVSTNRPTALGVDGCQTFGLSAGDLNTGGAMPHPA
jgi:hypothetical protein